MSDPILACRTFVEGCDESCPCQNVHLLLEDAEGEIFATATLDTATARQIATVLQALADQADARKLKSKGRLS